MQAKVSGFLKKYVWLLPLIIVTIGILYFINLFERLYDRDLTRQISEKKQLVTLTETLSNFEDIKKSILTLDTFDNTYTYLLHDDPNVWMKESKAEIYHSADCPYVLKNHPHNSQDIRDCIVNSQRGSFVTKESNKGKIIWEFRHFTVGNEKLLVITGVSNYQKEPIDKELEIAIGFMLFITALLNWILVGFWKYKCCGACEIDRKKD